MFDKAALVGLLLATTATAELSKRDGCGSVWTDVATELKPYFVGSDGDCTTEARDAVLIPFQDCFPDGGCDGSIILTDECFDRSENAQLVTMCVNLAQYAKKYDVGAADLINFAAALATKACPGGPYIPFYVGREDSTVEPAKGQVPGPSTNATVLTGAYNQVGFANDELVALVGAHSVGMNPSGVNLDTTPGKMDSTTFYTETKAGTAPATLDSDRSLSTDPDTTDLWSSFATDQNAWEEAYLPA